MSESETWMKQATLLLEEAYDRLVGGDDFADEIRAFLDKGLIRREWNQESETEK